MINTYTPLKLIKSTTICTKRYMTMYPVDDYDIVTSDKKEIKQWKKLSYLLSISERPTELM